MPRKLRNSSIWVGKEVKNSLKRRKDEGAGPREKCTKIQSPIHLQSCFFLLIFSLCCVPVFLSSVCTWLCVRVCVLANSRTKLAWKPLILHLLQLPLPHTLYNLYTTPRAKAKAIRAQISNKSAQNQQQQIIAAPATTTTSDADFSAADELYLCEPNTHTHTRITHADRAG